MPQLLPPPTMRWCSAKSRSFLLGGPGSPPAGASTWTAPALRRSYRARENQGQKQDQPYKSLHIFRGTPSMVVAARVGNAVEWYDFAVYRAFAAVLAATFFAGQDRVADL